jgi:hypothetical protein
MSMPNGATLPDKVDDDQSRPSLAAQLAAFFRARPNTWIDGRNLARIAGYAAWRTRCSDLRRAPYRMTIENRQRHVRLDGQAFTVTEYRFAEEIPSDE